jgi:hypothetical protein
MNKTSNIRPANSAGDVVLREVWRAKDTLSAAYGHNLDKLFAETRKRERLSGHPLVNPPAKRRKAWAARRFGLTGVWRVSPCQGWVCCFGGWFPRALPLGCRVFAPAARHADHAKGVAIIKARWWFSFQWVFKFPFLQVRAGPLSRHVVFE